jgi:death-on-curing protein
VADAEAEDDGIVYLAIEDVLEFFAAIIGGTPAQAADQLRDRGALEGALARPQMHGHYHGSDVALQGAVLAHGIAESQSFVDGNKRAALIAMLTFLEINGVMVEASDQELARWIIDLSAGLTPQALAERIRAAAL